MSEHLDEQTLNLFLDGALDAAERQRAELHLAVCADCRVALADWHALFAALDALAPAVAPARAPAFTDGVLRRLGRRRRLWPWTAAQGALALGLLLWLRPQLSGWARGAQGWLADGLQVMWGWLAALTAGVAAWAGWLADGLTAAAGELNLSLAFSASLFQWAVLLGAALLLWLLGHRLLLPDNGR